MKKADFSNVQVGLRMFTFYAPYDLKTKVNCRVYKIENYGSQRIITVVTHNAKYIKYRLDGRQYENEGRTLFLENPIGRNPINSIVVSGFIGIRDLSVGDCIDYSEMLAITTNIYRNKEYIQELEIDSMYKIIPISYEVDISDKGNVNESRGNNNACR